MGFDQKKELQVERTKKERRMKCPTCFYTTTNKLDFMLCEGPLHKERVMFCPRCLRKPNRVVVASPGGREPVGAWDEDLGYWCSVCRDPWNKH